MKNLNNDIKERFGYCKGGYFNIHIWAWFAAFTAQKGKSGSIYLVKNVRNAVKAAHTNVYSVKILTVYSLTSVLRNIRKEEVVLARLRLGHTRVTHSY